MKRRVKIFNKVASVDNVHIISVGLLLKFPNTSYGNVFLKSNLWIYLSKGLNFFKKSHSRGHFLTPFRNQSIFFQVLKYAKLLPNVSGVISMLMSYCTIYTFSRTSLNMTKTPKARKYNFRDFVQMVNA